MIISGIFHVIFLDHGWPWVTETVKSETEAKGGLLYMHYIFFKLKYSWCAILYKLQVYPIVMHNFKDYTLFVVIIKYRLYFLCVQYILVAYFTHNGLYLLIPSPSTAPLPINKH